MKKSFVIVTLAVFIPLLTTAQQTNDYKYKLDSIVYENFTKEVYHYDDRWNCTEIKTIYIDVVPNFVDHTTTFTYDDENHILKTVYYNWDDYREIHEYSYNEIGLLEHDIQTTYYHNGQKYSQISIYEYNENKQVTDLRVCYYTSNGIGEQNEHTRYEYENGLLMSSSLFYYDNTRPDVIKTYTYNDQGLCVEIIENQGPLWLGLEKEKTIFTYDEDGNRTSQTILSHNDDDNEWITDWWREYVYDDHGNCIAWDYYEKDGYHLQYTFTYDLSFPISDIAGLMTNWGFDFIPNNMVLFSYKNDFFYGTSAGPFTFHYSSHTEIDEKYDNQLKIWPNPVSETLYLDIEDLQCVDVYSLDGRLVFSSETSKSINVKGLSNGSYLLRATFADGSQRTQRFVVAR